MLYCAHPHPHILLFFFFSSLCHAHHLPLFASSLFLVLNSMSCHNTRVLLPSPLLSSCCGWLDDHALIIITISSISVPCHVLSPPPGDQTTESRTSLFSSTMLFLVPLSSLPWVVSSPPLPHRRDIIYMLYLLPPIPNTYQYKKIILKMSHIYFKKLVCLILSEIYIRHREIKTPSAPAPSLSHLSIKTDNNSL